MLIIYLKSKTQKHLSPTQQHRYLQSKYWLLAPQHPPFHCIPLFEIMNSSVNHAPTAHRKYAIVWPYSFPHVQYLHLSAWLFAKNLPTSNASPLSVISAAHFSKHLSSSLHNTSLILSCSQSGCIIERK